ncbi:MAG: hypothetical protein KJT03_23375, partial [Verrucomicrobiae bacterium]|nr:hypothetical protein [Verrucomicrobiae bacterium]
MKTPTTQIQGIGPATATLLTKNGYKSAEDIASADIESLCKIPGFSAIRAGRVIAAATAIIPVTEKASSPSKKKGKTKSGKPKSKDKKKAGKSKDKSKK